MSWNLLIYKPGATAQTSGSLGTLEAVTAALNRAFAGLVWDSATEAGLPVDEGFDLRLTVEHGAVQDMYTHGGFHHLREFAAMCKQEGWLIADAQEGEDVDLADPYRWYEERNG